MMQWSNAHSPQLPDLQVLGLEWLDGLEDGFSDEFDMSPLVSSTDGESCWTVTRLHSVP